MVYVRKITVKDHIYFELVKCERDKDGEPRQEHLQYLGKHPLREIDVQEKSKARLNKKEKIILKIIHELTKGKINHVINLKKLYLFCKKEKIPENVVDNFLERIIKKNRILKKNTNP